MEGFDAKFDPPLDKRLECPICLLAQREPMQTPCGHRFCSACILRALRETGPKCPVDNTRVAVHQLFKDNFAKREVLSLHVRCHANELGCTWQGELRKLELHEKACGLINISCPNECGHQCQRKDLYEHLPSCSNQPTQCSMCSISFNKNKIESHAQLCSKIKLPESTLGDIMKANEILKWTGQLKMKLHGQNYSVTGYLTAKMDSEERFIHSGCWSSNIALIPLTGSAARIFWRTLQGPEVKPLDLFFNVLNVDSRSSAFQKMIKKKFNAVTGLRSKPTSRRELTILFIYWSDSEKRTMACVAELKNYLVKEMQNKLQQLKRTSQLSEITLEGSRPGPSHRGAASSSVRSSGERGGGSSARSSNERGMSSRRGAGYNNLRIVNVPPSGPPSVSVEPPTQLAPASHVLPSILSWQLSPSFPAYPWRAAPSVPFFTIPSTPPQFLPAHSYPYTFAPMPAIAAPPFSINPGGVPVPASLAIPSYAGVSVPQVTGLHAELVVSSASGGSSLQGAQNFVEGSSNGAGLLSTAVIHQFSQPVPDPLSIPAHPNQVSVVVDPRGGISIPAGEVPPITQQGGHDRVWPSHQWQQSQSQMSRANWFNNSSLNSSHSTPSPTHHPILSTGTGHRNHGPDNSRPRQSNDSAPQGGGHSRQTSSPSSLNSPASLPFFSPIAPGGLDSSDDELSDVNSPFQWPNPGPSPHRNAGTPSTGSSNEQSPSSGSSQGNSALQTLADAAAFLSSSPHSETGSSDETDERTPSSYQQSTMPGSDSFSSDDSFGNLPLSASTSHNLPPAHQHRPNPLTASHRGNIVAVPDARGYPPPSSYRHQSSGLEEIPVFVPVIHPTVEEPAVPGPTQMLYAAPPEGGILVPTQQPLAEVTPLIHVAQGSRNIMPVSDPWPALVEPPQAAYIHSRPLLQGAGAANGGGFWEEVMPSLDMRLHESHAPQQPSL